MKCPYCKEEMEQGFIRGTGAFCRLGWYPSKASSVSHLFFAGDEINVSSSIQGGARLDGFRCRKCRKIVIDC